MSFLRKILLIAIITVLAGNAEGMAAAETVFDLPHNTPGLMKDEQIQKVCGQDKKCVHVIVPGTLAAQKHLHGYTYGYVVGFETTREYVKKRSEKEKQKDAITAAMAVEGNIYFPADGTQPTTEEAGIYSCANVNSDHVTDWYVKAFGGDTGVELSQEHTVPTSDLAPQMGFAADGSSAHIITVNTTGAPVNFDKDFWQTFRIIASDPVGRVLLYRILIEIRRQNAGSGVCEMSLASLLDRNDCRSITVNYDPEIGFVVGERIDFHFTPVETTLLSIQHNMIFTKDMPRTPDIALFHEMMHWFHYLRNPMRYDSDKRKETYQYLTRCYYKDISELFTWGNAINNEEIRTILGTPNYSIANIRNLIDTSAFFSNSGTGSDREQVKDINTGPIAECYILKAQKFLNGDDLSENVYRLSKHSNSPGNAVRMRWGHGIPIAKISIALDNSINEPNDIFNRNRFILANLIAGLCYKDISGEKQWRLGCEATEP